VIYGINAPDFDHEGRTITLEYPDFYVLTCYTPNSGSGLKRLDFRMGWEAAFLAFIQSLDANKPIIFCGDLNVAHTEIDLKNPKSNHHNAGFTDDEREKFGHLLEAGFTDTFRYFNPDATARYSWWSYRFHARDNNAGWRIDYFITSNRLADQLQDADILDQVMGSDHCPVELNVSGLTV